MPPADPTWLFVAAVCAYVAALAVPGIAVGMAAGLRGWVLAGLTPVLGYAVLGLAGPWLHAVGVPFNLATALGVTVVLALAIFAARWAVRRRWGSDDGEVRAHRPEPKGAGEPSGLPFWSRNAHLGVAACVAIAFLVSAFVVVGAAEGTLDAISQRWDMVFHANGVRYIGETGDGGLYGVSSVNRYGPEGSQFYPNGYHLAGSLVYLVTGGSVPLVINAMTVPLAGIFALSMAALVRECSGRSVFAGAAALTAAAATSGAYESISNGLVPFALSVALTPLGPLAIHRYVTRPSFDNGLVLVIVGAGLLSVHSSALFAALIFAAPMLVRRWRSERGTIGKDVLRLLPIAVAGALLTAPHLLGALNQATGSYGYRPWSFDKPLAEPLMALLLFQPAAGPDSQYLLAALVIIGVLTHRRLNGMRWLIDAAVIFGVLWVLVASFGGLSWVVAISRPWWNDHFRMIALASIPLSLIAAHGLAETQRWLARQVDSYSSWVRRHPQRTTVAGLAAAVLVISVVGVATSGFYARANAGTVAHAFHKSKADREGRMGPIAVTPLEERAMHKMAELAKPGERVMNDRNDGSVWLYALTGVKSVAAHYDDHVPPKDAALLADRFRVYDSDAAVRAAVHRLNIRHVFVGDGSRYPYVKPDRGLQELEDVDFLRVVYRNPDATIYEITR